MSAITEEEMFNEDLYGLLGVDQTADLKEIQKAWRKMSLTCHPDKFPDDQVKAALFLKITKALDILSDPSKRANYDAKHKAKALRLEKKRKLDDATRKMREDLEIREREAKRQRTEEDNEKIQLQREIERLREEGLQKIREQEMRRAEKLAQAKRQKEEEEQDATIKIKWDGHYTEENLRRIFSPFGEISVLLVGKKGGSAVLQYKNPMDAVNCFNTMSNHPSYDFHLEWAKGKPPVIAATKYQTTPSADSLLNKAHKGDEFLKAHQSFEDMILAKMLGTAKK